MSDISKEFVSKALKAFEKYKSDKEELNNRIKENDCWYKTRYTQVINPTNNEAMPTTAFLLSAIENKFSDAIDSYPVPNILARASENTDLSKLLSKIIPIQLEMSEFKKAYKANWRRKLKHGTGIYGIFYAGGKIIIRSLSVLNVYCDMHVNDVQDSQFLFIVNAVDNNTLINEYPQFADLFSGNAKVETFQGTYECDDKTEIIDCYYKDSNTVHCMKLCNKQVISDTETEGYENGLYAHGMYPVIFDVLYPEEDCPFGMGIIDVAKNPQMYIDKLDGSIIKNAVLSSKIRFMIKDNGSINEDEVLNCDTDIIHVSGNIDSDNIRELQMGSVSQAVMEHRNKKIEELKEIIGNRDFQQGATADGVTAASAITKLQETGNKLSRSMISDSYDCYRKIVYMTIELMREFYNFKHNYRITADDGTTSYSGISSGDLYDENNMPIEFDIEVVPQKQNPFERESNNELIMTLWNSGMFKAENLDSAIVAVYSMKFDGREQMIEKLKELKNTYSQYEKIQSGELVKLTPEDISKSLGQNY